MNLKLGTITHDIDIVGRTPTLQCRVDGIVHSVSEASGLGNECILLTVDERQYTVWRAAEGDRIHLKIGGRSFSVDLEDTLGNARTGSGDDELRADMPGVVVAVRCQIGDSVNTGDPVLTIESMKMQITLTAPRTGIVAAIHYELNQAFQKGAVLVALHAQTEAE